MKCCIMHFENIIENGAFAPMEQMLDFPYYVQKHSILKASKGAFNIKKKICRSVVAQ